MAIYRNIRITFWTDSKVVDDFTPEDRYFYLYLLTNPHTNLLGCYELSIKQASDETGYTKEVIENLLTRFEEVHNVIRYSRGSKEVQILNWPRFNWTSSETQLKHIKEAIKEVKNVDFRRILEDEVASLEGVSIPYAYPMDTTDTVTVTVSDTDNKGKGGMGGKPNKYEKEFEALWELYPRKQGKPKAHTYYERAIKNGTTYEEIERGIKAYVEYTTANGIELEYVKMGSTFFSQESWEDDWSYRKERDNERVGQIQSAGVNSNSRGLAETTTRGGASVSNGIRFPKEAYCLQNDE